MYNIQFKTNQYSAVVLLCSRMLAVYKIGSSNGGIERKAFSFIQTQYQLPPEVRITHAFEDIDDNDRLVIAFDKLQLVLEITASTGNISQSKLTFETIPQHFNTSRMMPMHNQEKFVDVSLQGVWQKEQQMI